MERKICKSMREFTHINRKKQMLMSHCSLRELSHWPLLWVTGTSCSSTDLLTWTFLTIHYSHSTSSSHLKAPRRTEKHDIISCSCYCLPEMHTGCWGNSLSCISRKKQCVTGQVQSYRQTRIPLLVIFSDDWSSLSSASTLQHSSITSKNCAG